MGFKKRFMVRVLYPLADKVIAASKGIELRLKEDLGLKNTKTIYNPISIDAHHQSDNDSISDHDQKIIESASHIYINIASLTKQKGQWHLIRAFKKVVKEKPEAKLIILGEGPLRSDLESLITASGLEKNVFMLGNKDNVFSYLKLSDCFVLSSVFEGLPLVLLEAVISRLPVVSTDCPYGPREVLTNIPLKSKATYPYYGHLGILTTPTCHDFEFASPTQVNLTKSEKELAEAMLSFEKLNPHARLRSSQLERFRIKNLTTEWLDIIME